MSEQPPGEPASGAAGPDPAQDDGAAAGPAPDPVPVRVRRAPRYRAFVLTGALLGALVGVVASLLVGNPDSVFSVRTITGYLGMIGFLLGALFGGAVAVVAERPRR